MTAPETVLVTGATGTVGRALLVELAGPTGLAARHDLQVRALSRNPAAAVPAGVQLYVGDLTDEPSLDRALRGVTRLFLLSSGTHIAAHDAAAVSAARSAGVQHIVKLSALGVGRGGTDPITTWHRTGEQHVRDSGTAWTMLRPTGFMTNTLDWAYSIRATSTVHAPFPHGRTALVDPRDIARVAALALTEDGHAGQTYELTGPEPLTPGDQVRVLADVLNTPITYLDVAPEAARAELQRYGMPPELATAVVELLASALEPWNALPLPDVERVTGRRPTDFRGWAHDHRAAFRP